MHGLVPCFLYKMKEWRWRCWSRIGRYAINAMGRHTHKRPRSRPKG